MARTSSNDPLLKYKFQVSIPGLPTGMGFTKVGGISREINVTEYNEGGTEYTQKLPGKEKFSEVVCEKGAFGSTELKELYAKALSSSDFRNTIVIEHLNRLGEVAATDTLAEAWISKYEGSDLDASSSDTEIEKITIQYEYLL